MMPPDIPGIFVVGTDTGVGKTRVAAALARSWMLSGHRVGVLKPVSTGGTWRDGRLGSSDVALLAAAITTAGSPFPPPPPERVGPLVFEPPLAPVVAARRVGSPLEPVALLAATVDARRWWLDEAGADHLVVEGVGGLLCPIAEGGYTVADLAADLGYPLLVVAHRGLGTLNHTLLTVEVARARGLPIAGIVLNAARVEDSGADLAGSSNAAELARFLPGVPILADWPHGDESPPVPIAPDAADWLGLARAPRPIARVRAVASPMWPSVIDAPSLSGDALAEPSTARGLLDSSSGSADRAPAGPPIPPAADPAPMGLTLDLAQRSPLADGRSRGPSGRDPDAPTTRRNVLLTSYASATTLALGWLLLRRRRIPDRGVVAPTDAAADIDDHAPGVGRLAGRSRTVVPPAPIPGDRTVALGGSLALDSLVIEPIGLERRDLRLDRVGLTGRPETRDGGRAALVLRVRLRNRSADSVFAPVDPAFVRPDASDNCETLVVFDDGRKVYTYPLAVDSEWSITGQGFGDLRPGESREVVFATTPDAPAGAERSGGVWRLKLRTGAQPTAVVGVRLAGG